jgi:hypothetical protein
MRSSSRTGAERIRILGRQPRSSMITLSMSGEEAERKAKDLAQAEQDKLKAAN